MLQMFEGRGEVVVGWWTGWWTEEEEHKCGSQVSVLPTSQLIFLQKVLSEFTSHV